MRTRLHVLLACLALALPLAVSAGARAATPSTTPVHLDAAQVAQTLFVAGDVGRLSQTPSGTESVVLEKVLQQLYMLNPTLPASQAVADIQGLQATLSSGSRAISPATLTVMAGNERILAVLRALTGSNAPPEVQHALAQVTAQALTASAQSTPVPRPGVRRLGGLPRHALLQELLAGGHAGADPCSLGDEPRVRPGPRLAVEAGLERERVRPDPDALG